MDSVSRGMKSLCEEIIIGHKNRKDSIKQIKIQAEAIRDDARIFLAETKKFQEDMAKELRKVLQKEREELIENVNVLREDFRKKEKEVRTDLAKASKIWNNMNETLRIKKSKSK